MRHSKFINFDGDSYIEQEDASLVQGMEGIGNNPFPTAERYHESYTKKSLAACEQ